jgi:hypothetical protein
MPSMSVGCSAKFPNFAVMLLLRFPAEEEIQIVAGEIYFNPSPLRGTSLKKGRSSEFANWHVGKIFL